MKLALEEARLLQLKAQGLLSEDPWGRGKDGAARALEHLGFVQIDTISVVERAHHHIFWSRVSDYRPAILDELVEDRSAFEYWSHAASFLPLRDYRFSLPRKKRFASGEWQWFKPTAEHKSWRRRILSRIRAEGPLPARAFESAKKNQGWWDWKPAKQVLEQLFHEGRLMVARRDGFQKLYDLSERVLPQNADRSLPRPGEQARYLIDSCLRANAFGTLEEIAYLRRGPMREIVARELKAGVKDGTYQELEIEGLEDGFFARPEELRALRSGPLSVETGRARILSPFDPVVIQRRRLKNLHGLDYQIECYVPAPKRKFGYFCLPLMVGDRFVGRMDAKAHRAEGTLEVLSLHLENKSVSSKAAREALRIELERFAAFNGCRKVLR